MTDKDLQNTYNAIGEIIRGFTTSIQAMTQTLGMLQGALMEISRKLDYVPKEEYMKEKIEDFKEEALKRIDDLIKNMNIEKNFSTIQTNLEKHFNQLRLDMVKYEQFILTLKEKVVHELCAEDDVKRSELELKKEELKEQKIDRREEKNRKFQLLLKILSWIVAGGFALFSIIRGIFGY